MASALVNHYLITSQIPFKGSVDKIKICSSALIKSCSNLYIYIYIYSV